MVASFVMALGYVVQVNASTSKGYVLRDQERAIERLRTETMVLESKAMQLASVDAITERAKAQGMEPVEEVRFVKAGCPRHGGPLIRLAGSRTVPFRCGEPASA